MTRTLWRNEAFVVRGDAKMVCLKNCSPVLDRAVWCGAVRCGAVLCFLQLLSHPHSRLVIRVGIV